VRAKGGYSTAEQEMLFCVVTRLEVTRLETIAKTIDPTAFVVVFPIHEASGGVVKRRVFH
jgi:uncharacterized membrane-anchored protein YitT (DUF2179 family)